MKFGIPSNKLKRISKLPYMTHTKITTTKPSASKTIKTTQTKQRPK